MSTVIVTASVKDLVVDASTKVGGYKVSITGQPDQTVPALPATFADVGPGTYTAVVQLVDASGVSIGGSSSASFTIAAPTITVSVPDIVSVPVSP